MVGREGFFGVDRLYLNGLGAPLIWGVGAQKRGLIHICCSPARLFQASLMRS
jgi:hypothetical protein